MDQKDNVSPIDEMAADCQEVQRLIDYFADKLKRSQEQLEAYNRALQGVEKYSKLLGFLESFHAALRGENVAPTLDTSQATEGHVPTEPEPESGFTRKKIVEILESAGHSLSVADIAKRAHRDNVLQSSNGYRGIYSTISTTLRRNNKHLFIRVRKGRWDLRSRRIKTAFEKALSGEIPAMGIVKNSVNGHYDIDIAVALGDK